MRKAAKLPLSGGLVRGSQASRKFYRLPDAFWQNRWQSHFKRKGEDGVPMWGAARSKQESVSQGRTSVSTAVEIGLGRLCRRAVGKRTYTAIGSCAVAITATLACRYCAGARRTRRQRGAGSHPSLNIRDARAARKLWRLAQKMQSCSREAARRNVRSARRPVRVTCVRASQRFHPALESKGQRAMDHPADEKHRLPI